MAVPPMRVARYDHGATVGTDGIVYVVGGVRRNARDVLEAVADVEAYNPLTNTWSDRAPMPRPLAPATAIGLPDGRIFVTGSDQAFAYSPMSNTWEMLLTLPAGLQGAMFARGRDGRIYAFGGERYFPGFQVTTTALVIDLDRRTSSSLRALPRARTRGQALSASDGSILIFGGMSNGMENPTDIVDIYDPATNTYTGSFTITEPRANAGITALSDGRIFVAGGRPQPGQDNRRDLLVYSSRTGTASFAAPMVQWRAAFPLVSLSNNTILAIGGQYEANRSRETNTISAYDIASNTWR